MVTNKTYYYGIKYRVIKIDDNNYFLFPVSLVGGLSDKVTFSTDHGELTILRNKNSFTKKYLVSNVYYTDDLEKLYDYDEDTNVLGKYFFEENSKIVLYVEILPTGTLKINKMDTSKYDKSKIHDSNATYYYENGEACAKINEAICNQIEECNDIEEIKKIFAMYKTSLQNFKEFSEDGVTRIDTVNNKITSIELNKTVQEDYEKEVNIAKEVKEDRRADVSKKGLYNAIRENVFGHDKEIGIISRRLYRNYIAPEGRKTKSVLIVGPSGTGKTETIKSAAKYLDIPFSYVNTASLVSSGIVGDKIDTALLDLYYQSGKDIRKAERGMVFLDEYDKIGHLDVKSEVKSELLPFNAGEKIHLSQLGKGVKFDSSRTMKVYGGVFEKLIKKMKIGFGDKCITDNNGIFIGPEIKNEIIKNGYFTEEEIGRIPTLVRYDYLDRATKKDALLHSKVSYLLECIKTYKEDFGVDMEVKEEFLDALLDIMPEKEGLRDVISYIDEVLDVVEDELCDVPKNTYKKLILTKDIVYDHSKFILK